jgi:DNA-3-methyladenine glycosylase I
MNANLKRCEWCLSDPIYMEYHDKEWGVPVYDDQYLFELLNLEGAQAGLSWITVLKKRNRYREVFDGFDPNKIVHYDHTKVNELLQDAGIIRNKLKINAVITNARAFLNIMETKGSFTEYLWTFVNGHPIQNNYEKHSEIPVKTIQSDLMSKQLKKDGFKFTGSTICYAFMQASGMVNDHLSYCFTQNQP